MKQYQYGELIHFHRSAYGRFLLESGWSADPGHPCWTDGDRARLSFRLVASGARGAILRLRCSGFQSHVDGPPCRVEVSAGGRHIGRLEVAGLRWHELTIPATGSRDADLVVEFKIINPQAPSDGGASQDTRRLGLHLHSLVLFEAMEPRDAEAVKIGAGRDAMGDVYLSKGAFHRAIHRSAGALFETLHRQGVFRGFAALGLMPEFSVRRIDDGEYSHIISSVTGTYIPPPQYPWSMLKDAALAWVRIGQQLATLAPPVGLLGLEDGHYGNFIQVGNAQPQWCDLGSISARELAWRPGLKEFIGCYLVPLLLLSVAGLDARRIRMLMSRHPEGLDARNLDQELHALIAPALAEVAPNKHKPWSLQFEQLAALLQRLDPQPQDGSWSGYRSPQALEDAWNGSLLASGHDPRFNAVIDVARRTGAGTFMDVGCNDGIFSLLCARLGMKGIACDIDDVSLEKLYSFVRERPQVGLAIAHAGFNHVEGQAELVLALALTHHLALSQGLGFERIAAKLAQLSTAHVITEFMPDGLGGTPQNRRPHPDPLPSYYTLENFVGSLGNHFRHVEVVKYERPSSLPHFSRRILIHCRGPKQGAAGG